MADRKTLGVMLVLLVLASGCLGTTTFTYGAWDNWITMGLLALLTSYILLGLVYVVANVFGLRELYIVTKNELYQTSATAVMLGALIVFIPFINALTANIATSATSLTFTANPASYDFAIVEAQTYSTKMTQTVLKQTATLTAANLVAGILRTLTVRKVTGRIGGAFSPYPFLRPVMETTEVLINALNVAFGVFYMQFLVLEFVKKWALMLILPVGVVLRSFPFTRMVGGTMIAIAIALWLVLPLCIIMNRALVEPYYSDPVNLEGINNLEEALSSTSGYLLGGAITLPNLLALLKFKGAGIWGIIASGAMLSLAIWLIFAVLKTIPLIAFTVMIAGILLPVINITITLNFMQNLSRLLGGEVNFGTLMKFI